MDSILGVDVSHYQGKPDWRRVAGSGVRFAVAKATEGATYVDPSYAYNRTGIPTAGLIPGAYHFLVRSSPAAAQADHFAAHADPQAIHALDVEASGGHLDVAGWVARYRHYHPTHPLLVYTGRDLWRRAGGTRGASYGLLWLAGYLPNAYVSGTGGLSGLLAKAGGHRGGLPWGGWDTAAMMQFTASAYVPGIAGKVDGDVWLGTLPQLRALTGTASTLMTPEDDMAVAPADVEAIARRTAELVTGIDARNPVVVDPGTGAAKLKDGRDIDAIPTVLGELQHEQRRQAAVLDRILAAVQEVHELTQTDLTLAAPSMPSASAMGEATS